MSGNGRGGYDFFSPEALLDPYPLYKRMREEDPVHYSEAGGFWILTRHRDVAAALRDTRLSADRKALFTSQLGNLDTSLIQNFFKLMSGWMIEKDPPEHTQLRKIASRGFTPRALESWRPIIQQTTDRLLDEVQDRHAMDIVADLSCRLPAQTIAEIFGVPRQDHAKLIDWALDIATFWGAPGGEHIEELARKADSSSVSFVAYLREIIEERRRRPGTDMISLLAIAYEEQGLSLEQLPALCIMILNAGHVTSADMIPNGFNALLRHPEQFQKLKDNPGLVNSAVEEMMRFDTSVPCIFRIAKEDVSIEGKVIPKGGVIALGLAAANHDPEEFESPEDFDITRSPNNHFGLGLGIHFCLGAILARMEMTTCFSTLLRRMPNIRRDPDKLASVRRTSLAFKGFDSLPVTF
ncbi:cytochrome P450 [Archangium sp.]|uniref:cytochrome P450 n=1 Tax=Archangium sp. TaxID=1872627 RepID=UPI00286D5DFB|nr:cytochrome P450 [Archangium sp.]